MMSVVWEESDLSDVFSVWDGPIPMSMVHAWGVMQCEQSECVCGVK